MIAASQSCDPYEVNTGYRAEQGSDANLLTRPDVSVREEKFRLAVPCHLNAVKS
jgi:hypothetical protein